MTCEGVGVYKGMGTCKGVGCRIKELRSYLGLSLADFGNAIGYTATHVSRLEKGGTEPKKVSSKELVRHSVLIRVILKIDVLGSRMLCKNPWSKRLLTQKSQRG